MKEWKSCADLGNLKQSLYSCDIPEKDLLFAISRPSDSGALKTDLNLMNLHHHHQETQLITKPTNVLQHLQPTGVSFRCP